MKWVLVCCGCLVLGSSAILGDTTGQGFVEGNLTILQSKEVQLAGETPGKSFSTEYAEFPLVVLRKGSDQEIGRVTADKSGHYRLELPTGDYVLDVADRARRHLRAQPKPFSVVSGQTSSVDFILDTGVR